MKFQNLTISTMVAMLAVSCAQAPTTPTKVAQQAGRTASPVWDTGVRSLAAGDAKSGPTDIDLNLLRVAQAPGGVSAFYASAGGSYGIGINSEVEIYAQIWTSNPAITNPRIIVDWGNGERDNTGCGSCRLSKTYRTGGSYRVTVTLDDRVNSTTSRTFTLNVGELPLQRAGFGVFNGELSTTDATHPLTFDGTPFGPPTPSPGTCSVIAASPYYNDLFTVVHDGGPIQIQVTSAAFSPFVGVYRDFFSLGEPCRNIVAINTSQADYPPGRYVIVVSSFSLAATGPYTVSIQ